jgi:tRNA(Ile)-lysidine synthase
MRFISSIIKTGGFKLTVALSGGCDSLAVAHFIKTRYPNTELKCFHFNHMLRQQNFDMQRACMDFCKDYTIPLKISSRDVSEQKGMSESDLRSYRYGSMKDLGFVVTGHHLDDAVENYLNNCFCGVPEYLPIPLITQFSSNLSVIRPFILTTKQEMRDYISQNNLQQYVVEDETNEQDVYKRNWLRNNIVPQINSHGYNLHTIVKKRYREWLEKEEQLSKVEDDNK